MVSIGQYMLLFPFFSRVEKALRWFDGCMLVLSSFDTTNGGIHPFIWTQKKHRYRLPIT